MKTLRLPKARLQQFVSVLRGFGDVHAPVERDGAVAFRPLERWSDVRLDATRTVLPPKKYLLPPEETMFTYDPVGGYRAATEAGARKLVLLGVHACDVYGVNLLDEVFGGRPPDPYYRQRRHNVALIGMDCTPDEHCFCHSMRAESVDHGFDLFLFDIGGHYLTLVGTALGDDMVLAAGSAFEPVDESDIREYKRRSTEKRESFQLDIDIHDLPEIFELEYGNGLWEELGEKCLSCGSCSLVCPTCQCFDVRDTVGLGTSCGERTRCWDSCLFSSHAAISGGGSYRASGADRIKFRFYHKQRGFVAEYGRPSCVGCGRCIVACPVGIHIAHVLNELRGVHHAAH